MAAPSPSLLPFIFFTTTTSCGGEGGQPCTAGVGRPWDDHRQPCSALACHVLLGADAKHTQYHTSPTSHPPPPPPQHFPSLSPSRCDTWPHHNEEGECTTLQRSQYTCHGSKERWCGGWWVWAKGATRDERWREEVTQYLTHSHMYHLLLVFTGWHAGGGGHGWWWWWW